MHLKKISIPAITKPQPWIQALTKSMGLQKVSQFIADQQLIKMTIAQARRLLARGVELLIRNDFDDKTLSPQELTEKVFKNLDLLFIMRTKPIYSVTFGPDTYSSQPLLSKAAELSTPIQSDNKQIGELSCHLPGRFRNIERFFISEELVLLNKIALNIGDYITSQRARQAEAAAKKAQEEIKKTINAMKLMMSKLAHVLNTRISTIGNTADLLQPYLPEGEAKELAQTISATTNEVTKIGNRLRLFTEIQFGRFESPKISFPLKSLIQNLANSFQNQITLKNKKVKIGIYYSSLVDDTIIGPKKAIKQILTELIQNSINSTAEGHIEIGVSLTAKDLLFYVRDTGTGIEKQKLDLILRQFQNEDLLEHSFSCNFEMGLAICRALADNYGLIFNFVSQTTNFTGSVFSFGMKYKPDQATKTTVKTEETTNLKAKKSFSKANILIVDDEFIQQIIMKKFLGANTPLTKDRLTIASNGEEAIHIIKTYKDPEEPSRHLPFDLIIMDINMPKLNGIATTKVIRRVFAQDKIPQIPIIAWSAHADGKIKDNELFKEKKLFNELLPKQLSIYGVDKFIGLLGQYFEM